MAVSSKALIAISIVTALILSLSIFVLGILYGYGHAHQTIPSTSTIEYMEALHRHVDQLDTSIKQRHQSELKNIATSITSLSASLRATTSKQDKLTSSIALLQQSVESLQLVIDNSTEPTGQLHHWKPGDVETHKEKIAVIIESRAHGRLLRVIHQFMSVLDETWEFQIWFGNNNEDMLRNDSIIQQGMKAGRVKMYPFGRDIFDIAWYNRMLVTNLTWWEFVGSGTGADTQILFYHMDAALCASSPKKIDAFLQYDYIGAPWAAGWYGGVGGNGGLSLRRRAAMMDCVRRVEGYTWANDDGIFTECVKMAEERGERKIGHEDDSKTFSVQTIYYPTPFGVHGPWHYLSSSEVSELRAYCPEMEDAMRPLDPWRP